MILSGSTRGIKSMLVQYRNGNYDVIIDLEHGTKIRKNNLDFFEADTIESADVKITNCCDMGCLQCHENSTPNGKHGDILSPSFLDSLHPWTELAIGGGNPLSHPDLDEFLVRCQEHHQICNITVNQTHFEQEYDRIKNLIDKKLIYGVGISLHHVSDSFIRLVRTVPNAVVHVIAGLVSIEDLKKLANMNLKILILGYKQVRRGQTLYHNHSLYINRKIQELKDNLKEIIESQWFSVVSFDNLALNQMDLKNIMTDRAWDFFYMGDDGQDGEQTSASMFIDMVERKFAKNSCASESERYPLMDSAEEMYRYLCNLSVA